MSVSLFIKCVLWIRNKVYKRLLHSRWSVNVMTLTARPRVSSTCVSAFHLWFQDHPVPQEQGLKLRRAILTPTAPPLSPSFAVNGNPWQFYYLERLDKEIGRNDVLRASSHSVANMEPRGPPIPFALHSQAIPNSNQGSWAHSTPWWLTGETFFPQRFFSVGLPQAFTQLTVLFIPPGTIHVSKTCDFLCLASFLSSFLLNYFRNICLPPRFFPLFCSTYESSNHYSYGC